MSTMYCTVAELRIEGVEDPPDDARLEQLIIEASEYIDLVTRMWFEERTLTLKLDGSGERVLHMHIPIRAITAARVENDVVDPTLYVVYNRMFPDDRTNPRVTYKRTRVPRNVFEDADNPSNRVWRVGEQNVELDGTFGYVDTDPDGTNPRVPRLINRACKRIVILIIPLLADTESVTSTLLSSPGMLSKEVTDGHSYTVENAGVQEITEVSNRAALGLTGDVGIDKTLLKFIAKRPRFGAMV